MASGQITERSLYPPLIRLINEYGGQGASEVLYKSVPDIIFELDDRTWILSVKIGEDIKTLKDAFLQYLRHKEDSQIAYGLILTFPTSIRDIAAQEDALYQAVRTVPALCLIDAEQNKEELRETPFAKVLDYLKNILPKRLDAQELVHYSMRLVTALLQQQVIDMMAQINLTEDKLLDLVTNRDLLTDLSHLKAQEVNDVAKFLAAYILMSQILFLRLFVVARPDDIAIELRPISHTKLRHAFSKILAMNYRPIYAVDILDNIDDKFLEDIFDLIWGLAIENVRYELPGRIFHELMPMTIRKMLAAFYTRPLAADLLAALTIEESGATVLDPACGSGTILVSAYKRKLDCFRAEHKSGNPHKRFCENEIFGIDIMPFSVHLTSANLAALDIPTTIAHTQIIQGDGLRLTPGMATKNGVQLSMFPEAAQAKTTHGQALDIELDQVDTVLMNPPFTKVERGISQFVAMDQFHQRVGGEIGLWGHFIALADIFLKEGGIYGAVIPINLLRGRESTAIREFIFQNWTPLYIIKATRNYAFSEWSEYRDILLIARKALPAPDHQVKVALIKQDLTQITKADVSRLESQIKTKARQRTQTLDIESFSLAEIRQHFTNLMWIASGVNLRHRDRLVKFINKVAKRLDRFPEKYFRTGYRPAPQGISEMIFLTRRSTLDPNKVDPRTEEAFLMFEADRFGDTYEEIIIALSHLKVTYRMERAHFKPSLRTGVGLTTFDITYQHDYVAYHPYKEWERMKLATGIRFPNNFDETAFWERLEQDINRVETQLVVTRRINPFSPSVHGFAFYHDQGISPADQFNIVQESNHDRAKAVCVLLNALPFLVYFFLLKEESTGRFIDIRLYDLHEMSLYPTNGQIPALVHIFETFRHTELPALRSQLDLNFDARYEAYWAKENGDTTVDTTILQQPVYPAPERLQFDLAVCKAIGVSVSEDEIRQIYQAIVEEMILIRRLARD